MRTYTLLMTRHLKVVVVVMNVYNKNKNKNRRPTHIAVSRLVLTKFRRSNLDVVFISIT